MTADVEEEHRECGVTADVDLYSLKLSILFFTMFFPAVRGRYLHLLKKLGDYKYKSGPMGPSMASQILNKKEAGGILAVPRSKLLALWNRDNVRGCPSYKNVSHFTKTTHYKNFKLVFRHRI